MQEKNVNAASTIARQMADLGLERGTGLTREELLAAGFDAADIDEHAGEAARLFAEADRCVAA